MEILHKDAYKPSKKEALKIIKSIENNFLSDLDKSILELFFTPPIGKTPITAFDTAVKLINSIPSSETREYLKYLHIKNGVAICTNAIKIIRFNTDLEDGVLDIKTNNYCNHIKKMFDQYSNVFNVFNDESENLIIKDCEQFINKSKKYYKINDNFGVDASLIDDNMLNNGNFNLKKCNSVFGNYILNNTNIEFVLMLYRF